MNKLGSTRAPDATWNLASIGPVVSEEMFENVDTHTYTHIHTYPRTTEAYLHYKLTYEPKGSGELKSVQIFIFPFSCEKKLVSHLSVKPQQMCSSPQFLLNPAKQELMKQGNLAQSIDTVGIFFLFSNLISVPQPWPWRS